MINKMWGFFIIVGIIFTAILMVLMFSGWDPLMGLIHGLNQSWKTNISAMGLLSLIVSIGPFIYISLPILKAGWNGLIHKNLNMDVMYSMGILVAYVSSILGTFGIVLDSTFMFYDSAVMLPSFLMIGRYLEARAKKKTSDSIRELIGLQPTSAVARKPATVHYYVCKLAKDSRALPNLPSTQGHE